MNSCTQFPSLPVADYDANAPDFKPNYHGISTMDNANRSIFVENLEYVVQDGDDNAGL